MQNLRCPKCGEVFGLDEAGYDRIVKQVRDKEFEKDRKEKGCEYANLGCHIE